MKTIEGANKKEFSYEYFLEMARAGISHEPCR